MRNRYAVLGVSAFLALALAVPALGGPSNPISERAQSAKTIAKKALNKAKTANRRTTRANRKARRAQESADGAQASADGAQTSADGAQTTADAAQAAAAAAQTTADSAEAAAAAAQADADAAQATADSKYGSITNVEGDTSPTNNSDKTLLVAVCPSDRDVAGGGFIVNGAGNADAAPVFNSAYVSSWAVIADDQGTNGSNWNITPTVRCIG